MAEDDPTPVEVVEHLEALEESIDSAADQQKAKRIRHLGEQLHRFEQAQLERVEGQISRYTTRDVIETVVGATIFSLPLLVEGGVYEIGTHFATTMVYGLPIYFIGNIVFVTIVTSGMLYYAEFRDVEITYLFGVIPQRLTAVLIIAFLVAAGTMSLWGQLAWSDPFVAVCQISVVWTAGAFGAGLGDILPGESRGTPLGDLIE